ncbi:MAG: lipopolysaccharide heptosyltransferase II [Candidatus Omnitrophica bacterium]|nr:lipopolysaccharide heptosyltransferase II [Candidatus Omnitrophota bacterium]
MIKKILFITLSNIGDVILTLPALDTLRQSFPSAQITVICGSRPKELFENNLNIHSLIIFDKRSPLREKIRLFRRLSQEKFDLVVDLRNSFFGALLPARARVSFLPFVPSSIKHMKDRHLYKIQNLKVKSQNLNILTSIITMKTEEEEYINKKLKDHGVSDKDKVILIAPGARSHIKRWNQDKFARLIEALVEEFKAKIVLIGDKDDSAIAKYIIEHCRYPLLDLTGTTSLIELAYLLKKADLVVTNDSAILHLASYLDRAIVAIFGPTDEAKYGPWSSRSVFVKKDIACRPCGKAQCRLNSMECIQMVQVEDVLKQVRNILKGTVPAELYPSVVLKGTVPDLKRILIVRTDRIGDVVLSTPVIKAVRERYPSAYIAMMVSPYTKEIVEGNPYLDEVIIYDKDTKHKSWRRTLEFARNLKKKRFDLALILHPTNRVHLVTFLAGIKRRIGYDRKLGFLLTDRIPHTKQSGQKHELEYNFDLLKVLGITPADKNIFVPIKSEAIQAVDELLRREGIKEKDALLAINPGASCPSKIWPAQRFAEVADRLAQGYGFKVLVVAGPKERPLAQDLITNMREKAIDLAGRLSLSQLAALLSRCSLFISNDSGPVHIGSAVGVPVISIFGRDQKGLSPKRWGPVGKRDRFLHKPVGCIECLAHNCVREFKCMQAISTQDVLNVAEEILKGGV